MSIINVMLSSVLITA